MRRSTASAGTDRRLLGLLLAAELIAAAVLVVRVPAPVTAETAAPSAAESVSPPPVAQLSAAPVVRELGDKRGVQLVNLGGEHTPGLLARIDAELDEAAAAITAFWGDDWPRDIVIAAAGTDDQFRMLAGGGSDVAAAAVGHRIVFAPGAAGMSAGALRIVLRHELFHFAARSRTAADAPRWLTEGVADFVARPPGPAPGSEVSAALPTDQELGTPGPVRALAYDRAWWFSSFVADRYGSAALRALYLRACAPGHSDVASAVRAVLGADLDAVLAGWQRWLTG